MRIIFNNLNHFFYIFNMNKKRNKKIKKNLIFTKNLHHRKCSTM